MLDLHFTSWKPGCPKNYARALGFPSVPLWYRAGKFFRIRNSLLLKVYGRSELLTAQQQHRPPYGTLWPSRKLAWAARRLVGRRKGLIHQILWNDPWEVQVGAEDGIFFCHLTEQIGNWNIKHWKYPEMWEKIRGKHETSILIKIFIHFVSRIETHRTH